MNRRVLTWGVLLACSALFILGMQRSTADDGSRTSRYKTVQIQTTQYIWELVSNQSGQVICKVITNQPSRPTNEEAIQSCGDEIFPSMPAPATPEAGAATPTPQPTFAPFNLAEFFKKVYWRFVDTQELTRTVKVPLPEIIVNLTVPPGQKPPFRAIIVAYEPVFGQRITSIGGVLNGVEFTCPSERCEVPIDKDSILEFWAKSSFGDDSRHSQAVLVVSQRKDTSTLELASLTPITLYRDACSLAWGQAQTSLPSWANFPASPDELNTKKPYQYLAGKLIFTGVADASDCPMGWGTSNGGANTCGLEKANQAVIDWQNQFDVPIWDAGRNLGVPPRLIKTLIAQESQFWPGNSRNIFNEYGLGQISQTGADVALRWDNDLFGSICSGLIFDCSKIYGRLPSWMQATMRGGLIRSIDAECATCPHGVDLGRAYDSVSTVARTLRSNCLQVNYIMRNHPTTTTYDDYWRFTLVSYHSGYQCLRDAINGVQYHESPRIYDWEHVSAYLGCAGSQLYVNDLWKSLIEFNQYRLKPEEAARPVSDAVFSIPPTPTRPPQTPTPAPVLALSHIRVLVYVDANDDDYPGADEKAEGIKVTATLANGQVLTGTTQDGEVVFDLTGQPVDTEVVVALPELYRSYKVRVMRDGEIPVTFRLEKPVTPPTLP